MPSGEYVDVYLNLRCWLNGAITTTRVRNYLQDGLPPQSANARRAYSALMQRLPGLAGVARGQSLPPKFAVSGRHFLVLAIWRAFHGKGAPNEIQDALQLASLCGQVDSASVNSYADINLGIDCGGFVANYWGIGRPSFAAPNPHGATGFKPRTIWDMHRNSRRHAVREIAVDDAAVFFQDVRSDNPDIPAQLVNGAYDRSSGSQAFHIGLVAGCTVIDDTHVNLEIAESSGAAAASGGNGVNRRGLGQVRATVARNLVYVQDGSGGNRIYFIGRPQVNPRYLPDAVAPAASAS